LEICKSIRIFTKFKKQKFFNIHREVVAAVARQAHNLEVGGSIPSLATKKIFVKVFGIVKTISYLYKVKVEANNNKTDCVMGSSSEESRIP
jgi:hypothetical protein